MRSGGEGGVQEGRRWGGAGRPRESMLRRAARVARRPVGRTTAAGEERNGRGEGGVWADSRQRRRRVV